MNKEVLSKILILAAGAAIGSVATWKIVKTKYEQIAQEEVEEVRAYYARDTFEEAEKEKEPEKKEMPKTQQNSIERIEKNENMRAYHKIIDGSGYKEIEEEVEDVEKPYVISPEEFDEMDDYNTVGLVYFADKVLTDEDNEPIDDVEGTVGVASLNTFGEYEEDAVHVRNDKRKCDYEILKDLRNYSDVRPDYVPHNVEG